MSNNKRDKRVRRPPDVGRIIDRTIVRLWDTIEELESLNPAELHFYRVAVFGSARVQAGDKEYAEVREVASRLTELGCDIVTGGGPGLMEAANEGAASSRERGSRKTRSFGLTIAIPYEKANPYLDSVTAHRTFFSRLHHFVRMSQAFVIFPGGIGTALELMMVWQLLQVGFMTERPVILFGEMWRGLVEWMNREMVPRRLVNPEDLDLVHLATSVDEAIALIERHKQKFDSAREMLILERRRADRAEQDPPPAVVPEPAEPSVP
ncbi:MAG TPA: LOG family protein [Thermoanaerobaculia bacterium]